MPTPPTTGAPFPSDAVCRQCRYHLQGLPQNQCPECGLEFDPQDPSTFLTLQRLGRRRLRRWGGLVVLLALGAVAWWLAPRRIFSGRVDFTCADCGYVTTVRYWEPAESKLAIRFPGFHWRTESMNGVAASGDASPCTSEHNFSVNVAFHNSICRATASSKATRTGKTTTLVNDMNMDPDSAVKVLKALVGPTTSGVWISSETRAKDQALR